MFVAFVVAMVATMALMPLLMRASERLGMLDHPGPRKVHHRDVPRVGGLAMLAGVLIPLLALQTLPRPIVGILLGILVVVFEGVWDDRSPLGYRAKFAAQFLAAILVVAVGGIQIRELVLLDETILPTWLAVPLTVVVIVAMTNAINLADGLDGLAGGVSFLSCCALAVVAYTSGNTAAFVLAISLCGALLGFLRFNTFPARVFMGDGGSQLLGLAIGSLAIYVTQTENAVVSATMPLFLLAIPILDTFFVMVHRVRAGRSPFSADKNHLHHRLLSLGYSHGGAVALIYSAQAVLFLAAYLLRFESDITNIVAFAACGCLMLATLMRRRLALEPALRRAPAGIPAPIARFGAQVAAGAHRISMSILHLALIAYCVLGAILLPVPTDIGVLFALLLAVLSLAWVVVAQRFRAAEKSVVYVLAAALAYLFSHADWLPRELQRLEWILIVIIAVATAAALRFAEKPQFQLNTMDLLVLFTAIVVPNLPGAIWGDANLAALAARLAVLFYALELVMSGDREHATASRVAASLTLGALAIKGFV
jgi:UDP-GlcNAc:undecaprenyl-phosphate GlcNAc-1-phosphate transferase